MLRKKAQPGPRSRFHHTVPGLSRRQFLARSGIASTAAAAALCAGPAALVRPAEAAETENANILTRKTICPFCAVGCTIWAEVENGVWIGQEPAFESPVNMGTHCAKGAATRELAIGERRLKYPTKLVNGRWTRVSWDEALDEITQKMLQIREESGPESVYWLGSAKFSNEQAYLFRKFAAFWGTNNCDHQARICHSTTVAGVANTYGYGAMTNSFNDMRNSKSIFLLGGNPAEAHPVSMLHLLNAKENGATFIVVDPRFTRTAAHADEYVRIRPGADVAFLWGVLWHILENGWEDKEYISQRVFGFEDVRKEVANWTPEETERVTGVARDQIEHVARLVAQNRPGTLIWCMGLTQSSIGNNKTRAASIFQLALGNIGKSGGGANIFRGHDNVQGATDLGVLCHTLPAYYGLTASAWKHWARVWDVDYEWLKGRFASPELMETKGIPVSRWFDGVIEEPEQIEQPHRLRGMVFWGHAPNSQTRGPDVKAGLEQVELLVVIDPVPTLSAVLGDRQEGVYLLPAGSTMEIAGSVTNSNRSVQWREKVVEPIFEAKSDYEITYLLAERLGFAEELFKHVAVENGEPVAEDLLREINRGTWTIGYTGQSPERLKLHMEHQDKFDSVTMRGMSAPVEGEYYCLPWPCWGTPELGHTGTPLLYDLSKPVAEGGLPFRARWGVEREGQSLLASNSYTQGSEIEDGYPELTVGVLEKMGWLDELTQREKVIIAAIASDRFRADLFDISDDDAGALLQRMEDVGGQRVPDEASEEPPPQSDSNLGEADMGQPHLFPDFSRRAAEAIQAYRQSQDGGGSSADQDQGSDQDQSLREAIFQINWKTDLSGGIQRVAIAHGLAPFGNGRARARVWNFPDPIPLHREPLYTPRRDLIPQYRTYDDRVDYRLPTKYWSIQQNDFTAEYPMVLTSGRLVEYEGGGDETRANKWLAEFQQQMFVEINPADAERAGITSGKMVWVATPEGARILVAALVTPRVGEGVAFVPFHFGGMWQGEDLSGRYPQGTVPYVTGEAGNTATTYGYDVVTFMQESKATLCRIEAA